MFEFKVREYTFKILETDDPNDKRFDKLEADDKSEILGMFDTIGEYILIYNKVSPARFKHTLLHELTHAFLGVYSLNKDDYFSDEEVCEFVANYSYEMMAIADDYLTSRQGDDEWLK